MSYSGQYVYLKWMSLKWIHSHQKAQCQACILRGEYQEKRKAPSVLKGLRALRDSAEEGMTVVGGREGLEISRLSPGVFWKLSRWITECRLCGVGKTCSGQS